MAARWEDSGLAHGGRPTACSFVFLRELIASDARALSPCLTSNVSGTSHAHFILLVLFCAGFSSLGHQLCPGNLDALGLTPLDLLAILTC